MKLETYTKFNKWDNHILYYAIFWLLINQEYIKF
jgi:hypothetical protein